MGSTSTKEQTLWEMRGQIEALTDEAMRAERAQTAIRAAVDRLEAEYDYLSRTTERLKDARSQLSRLFGDAALAEFDRYLKAKNR